MASLEYRTSLEWMLASTSCNQSPMPYTVKEREADFVLRDDSTRKFLSCPSFHYYNVVYLPSVQQTKQRRQTVNRALRSSYTGVVQRLYNITHPGYSFVLLAPLYCGSAVVFRVLQADIGSLKLVVAILGIIHGAAEVIERSTMVLIDHICHLLWKRALVPWGSFRTPRCERLMADIAIMSMLFESTAIVSVNGFLYLYQFVYLHGSMLNLLQSFATYTSVQLVIEWFFICVSLAVETRYQNMAVMAVWRKRWKRHILAAILNVVPIALWSIVHGRFSETSTEPCEMPFS